MAAAFEEHPDLARVAVDPFMPVSAKTSIMKALFSDSQATEITKRLFSERRAAAGRGRLCMCLRVHV